MFSSEVSGDTLVLLRGFVVLCFFFFFKQKTAYEMCGRDWSSDVCSSDLCESEAMLASIAPTSLWKTGSSASVPPKGDGVLARSEERRVGKECRSRWSPYH